MFSKPKAEAGSLTPAERTVIDPRRLRRRGVFVDGVDDRHSRLAIGAYKQLRTRVLAELDSLGARSVLVTGPTAGVGKTTVSLNLAINISKLSGMKVVLIDLDLRGSSMQDILGTETDYGTERIADEDFSIARAALSLGYDGLLVLPCAKRTADSSERLLAPVALDFFRRMQRLPAGFLVIYDTPPVLGCDDVAAILPSMEAAIMVIEEGRTSRRELADATSRLGSLPVVTTVLNKSRDGDIRKYYY